MFRDWLLSLLPGSSDVEDIGYGPWVRASDQKHIERHLDLRELTMENQRAFQEAIRKAGQRAQSTDNSDLSAPLQQCLLDLADMVTRIDRGEPPLGRSDWREVFPPEARRIGPGWQ